MHTGFLGRAMDALVSFRSVGAWERGYPRERPEGGSQRGGREDLIVRGRTDTQNRKKSKGSGQLTTRI